MVSRLVALCTLACVAVNKEYLSVGVLCKWIWLYSNLVSFDLCFANSDVIKDHMVEKPVEYLTEG